MDDPLIHAIRFGVGKHHDGFEPALGIYAERRDGRLMTWLVPLSIEFAEDASRCGIRLLFVFSSRKSRIKCLSIGGKDEC